MAATSTLRLPVSSISRAIGSPRSHAQSAPRTRPRRGAGWRAGSSRKRRGSAFVVAIAMRDVGHAVGVAAIRVERAAPLPLVGVVPQALGIAQADVDVVHQLAEPFVVT